MDTFRILHVSDLHMAVRPRVVGFPDWGYLWHHGQGSPSLITPCSYDPDLTEGIDRYVSRFPGRFDAILLTGDLATTGKPADLDVARPFLDALAAGGSYRSSSPAPPAGATPAPVWIMPGNHDRFDGWSYMPGGSEFDAVFGRDWKVGRGVQACPTLQGPNQERLTVIAADFALASYWHSKGTFGWLGQGKVYADVLAALKKTTDLERDRYQTVGSAGIVWAVHFPPVFPGISPDLALLDEAFLPLVADALGVQHLLCGHTHVAKEYPVPNHPGVIVHCAGTAAQFVAEAGNVIHDTAIDVNGGAVTAVRRTDVVWNQGAGEFL